jgi:hypothetical protein
LYSLAADIRQNDCANIRLNPADRGSRIGLLRVLLSTAPGAAGPDSMPCMIPT